MVASLKAVVARRGLAVAAIGITALAGAGPAGAATVSVVKVPFESCDGTLYTPTLVYTAAPGERNKLSIATVGAGFINDPIGECVSDPQGGIGTDVAEVVSDPGAHRVVPGAGCQSVTKTVARCKGVEAVKVELLDGADSVAIDAYPDGSVISTGSGNDTIRSLNGAPDDVYCGTGVDSVTRDPFDFASPSCEHVTPPRL